MNFTDKATQPQTVAQERARFFGTTGSVASYYRSTSDGLLTLTGDVFGWYTIPFLSTSCDATGWETSVKAAAVNAGVDLSRFDYLVYVHPMVSCGYGGLARVGASGAWLNTSGDGTVPATTAAHELGHNFGAMHSAAQTCTNASGAVVTFSATCTSQPYGDVLSVMGLSTTGHHAGNAWRFGWITAQTVTGPGQYRITRRHTSGGAQMLRVPRPAGDFFDLELRALRTAWRTTSRAPTPPSTE